MENETVFQTFRYAKPKVEEIDLLARDWHFLEVLKLHGVRATLAHLSSRVLGDSRFLRPASTTDFRGRRLRIHDNLESFVHAILLELGVESQGNFILRHLKPIAETQFEFPAHWNSGESLRTFLFNITLILKSDLVVETGTANGASAAAISAALKENHFGLLHSFDIRDEQAYLLDEADRHYVNFIRTDGSPKELKRRISTMPKSRHKRIFVHDSDHSYFGQWSDYSVADKYGFDLLVSDDVDASLAFTDFAGTKGHVLLDGSKFIGAMVLNHE